MEEKTLKKRWLWALKRTRQIYFLQKKTTILEELLCNVAEHNCDKCIMKVFRNPKGPTNLFNTSKYCLNRNCLPYSNTADLPPTQEEEEQILKFFSYLNNAVKDFHGNQFVNIKHDNLMANNIRKADKEAYKKFN